MWKCSLFSRLALFSILSLVGNITGGSLLRFNLSVEVYLKIDNKLSGTMVVIRMRKGLLWKV